jgi:hypothetical protein
MKTDEIKEARQKLARLHDVLRALVDIKRCGIPNDNSMLHEALADGMLVLQEAAETAARAMVLAQNVQQKVVTLQARLKKLGEMKHDEY